MWLILLSDKSTICEHTRKKSTAPLGLMICIPALSLPFMLYILTLIQVWQDTSFSYSDGSFKQIHRKTSPTSSPFGEGPKAPIPWTMFEGGGEWRNMKKLSILLSFPSSFMISTYYVLPSLSAPTSSPLTGICSSFSGLVLVMLEVAVANSWVLNSIIKQDLLHLLNRLPCYSDLSFTAKAVITACLAELQVSRWLPWTHLRLSQQVKVGPQPFPPQKSKGIHT